MGITKKENLKTPVGETAGNDSQTSHRFWHFLLLRPKRDIMEFIIDPKIFFLNIAGLVPGKKGRIHASSEPHLEPT
jgi:hypothetical protein